MWRSSRPSPITELSQIQWRFPTEVDGQLTLHGVTKPLKLDAQPVQVHAKPDDKQHVCGADASATFDRSEFGIDYDADLGFKQEVKLQIQVEAIRAG